MPNLEITAAGRKRVASAEFAKSLVHVVGKASEMDDVFGSQCITTFIALSLLAERDTAPLPEPGAISKFINENSKEINATFARVTASPSFIEEGLTCFGDEGLTEFLAVAMAQA